MKLFKTKDFMNNGIHTKRYYFCGVRYLKKIWIGLCTETFLFWFKISGLKKSVKTNTGGITIVEIGGNTGEGKLGRTIIETLKTSNIIFDNCLLSDLYKNYIPKYKTQLVLTTANFVKNKSYNIMPLILWEFESGMIQARPYAFDDISGIVTFSTFCANYFHEIAPKNLPIYTLPYPVYVDLSRLDSVKSVREKYKIKTKDFVFFFNFSYSSSYFRKNPEGTLNAFIKAFPKHEKNIKLVIKTTGSSFAPDKVKRLYDKIQELNLTDNVVVIDADLTDYETYSLINCCDVYVSLHRGEGLGLGMMEAMYIGKPVIATNYGGNTDFTKEDTALLVDYKMVKPKEIDLDAYKYVEKWPEPNIETAAHHMLNLYKNAKLRKSVGDSGQTFIKAHFNKQNFNNAIKELLS